MYQDKLTNGEYTTLAQVESDCKRLVNNAKAYNDKKSIIYEDAERLRKTASNWMVKHNPAYRDGSYVAVATPIPGEENAPPGKPIPRIASTPRPAATPTTVSTVATERPRRAAALTQPETPVPSKLRQSASAAPEPRSSTTRGATNPSFQHAQEQIIQEVIDHTDPGYETLRTQEDNMLTCLQWRLKHLPAFRKPAYACFEGLLPTDQRSHVPRSYQEEGTGCGRSRCTYRTHFVQELGRFRERFRSRVEECTYLQRRRKRAV